MKRFFVIQNLEASTFACSYIQPLNSILNIFQYGSVESAMKFDSEKEAEDFVSASSIIEEYRFVSIIPIWFLGY